MSQPNDILEPAAGTGDTSLTPAGQQQQPPADAGDGDHGQPKPPAGGDILDATPQDVAKDPTAGDVLAGADDTKQEGVPDSYAFEPPKEMPEGVTLDEVKLEGFKQTAKEVGLTQAQFQQLVEWDLQRAQADQQAAVDAWMQRVDDWRQAAKVDKEFGGTNYEANVKIAMAAIDKFGDAELKAALRTPTTDNPEGLAIGNHPAFLRFFHRIGKALGDPQLLTGDAARPTSDEARLSRMYPSMFKDSA